LPADAPDGPGKNYSTRPPSTAADVDGKRGSDMKARILLAMVAPFLVSDGLATGTRPVECSVANLQGEYTGFFTDEEQSP
jgi:hypothetical protein